MPPRRKRAWSAGNDRELKVMELLENEGWLVASRRHWPGPADVLAVKFTFRPFESYHEVRLIEVKSTTYGPYDSFIPAERQRLVELADEHNAQAWLYWWPPRKDLVRIPASEFPQKN